MIGEETSGNESSLREGAGRNFWSQFGNRDGGYRRLPTRFLPLGPSQSQATSLPLSRFFPDAAGLSGFAPVTSCAGGLLALRRFPVSSADLFKICVCDPVAGTSTFLPPLPPSSFSFPENIVFLDADGSSFRLLAAMDHPLGILLSVFSSETGQWGTDVTAHLPDNIEVLLASPAVVHHGAVHWVCGTRAFPNAVYALAVRPGQAKASVRLLDLPMRACIHPLTQAGGEVRLSSSARGCLSLVLLDEPVISIWNFEGNGTNGRSWALHKTVYLSSVLPLTIFDPCGEWGLCLLALCGQSGSLFMRAVDQGLFVLNLETEKMSKVCNDLCAQYPCPYVANLSSCLGAMKNF